MKKQLYAILFLSLLLSSCTLYRKPEVPTLNIPEHFKTKSNVKLNKQWWKNFYDKKLNQLVDTAVKNNSSYLVALKNIQIASTYVTQNESALYPQANMNFNSTRNKTSPDLFNQTGGTHIYDLQQLTGSVSYEVDVWNQIRNSVKQAEANQASAAAASEVIRLSLITSVVDTYFQLMTMKANIYNLKQQYQSANQIVHLTQNQFKSGMTDASTLETVKNQAETIKINLINLRKQEQILKYTLAYLLGEYPERFHIVINKNIQTLKMTHLVPAGIPSVMVAHRPDIQEAYQQILAFGYLTKQNIANFLPAINLTGNYGYADTALSTLISSANSYWSYGVYITQFVFDYQSRMSAYRLSKYQYESAIISYRDTVLNAFKEVDSALISYQKDNEAFNAAHARVISSQALSKLYHAQYQSGVGDYPPYLTARLTDLQSRYSMNAQKLLVLEDVMQVYKALGLGF
ncbi:MAG: efflux transporter outer membrane subunit [Gammaproteobacteria bacterium]|nr:efflux transporter outer membrane subunit [Gammaproteobacteria bacterium]